MGDHPTHIQKKRTMMKDRVGCVRASTYNLPAEGHSYGMKTVQADEGVGTSESICAWAGFNVSVFTNAFPLCRSYLELGHRQSLPGEEEQQVDCVLERPRCQARVSKILK